MSRVFDWSASWNKIFNKPMNLRPCPVCWSMVDLTAVMDHETWHREVDDVRMVDGSGKSPKLQKGKKS